jgi:hypothetical protein
MNRWNSRAAHIVALVVSVAAVSSFSEANAGLVINASFAGGAPPRNLVGGGSLTTIFETAVSYWQAAYSGPDNWTVNLQFEWANLGGAPNAQFVFGSIGGNPLRIESGVIQFNNSGLIPLFADPTPADNSEFSPLQTDSSEAPGGEINTGRYFVATTEPAANNLDLLSLAEHEIGHALGLDVNNPNSPSTLEIQAPLPYAGLEMITFREHLPYLNSVMANFPQPGVRYLLSAADILADAQISQFFTPNLDPFAVPEPRSIMLLTIGVAGIGLCGARNRGSISRS